MIDPVVAERLARLRVLLHEALAATTDQTASGRHVSVIFLDGVCEMALHLAADEHGIVVQQRHSLEDVLGMVAGELGTSWNRQSSKAVRELHRARNVLQHHGVLPDASHVPTWASEVDRFVHSLVSAAFVSDLAAVTAATAVQDAELQEDLRKVEVAIDSGDFAGAMKAARSALGSAIRRFRSERGRSTFSRFGHQAGQFQEFRAIDQSLDALEDFVDVAYLASDPAEWLWLTRAVDRASSLSAATEADAHRAYAFALAWILRFEAFEARQPQYVHRDYPEPDPDVEYQAPRLVSAGEPEPDYDGGFRLFLGLEETPPDWTSSLFEGLRRLESDGQVRGLWATPSDSGIEVRVPGDIDPSSVRGVVDDLIAQTHAVFEERLAARREVAIGERSLADGYRAVLAAANDPRFGEVTVETMHEGRVYVRVAVNLEDAPADSLVEQALNAARPEDRVHINFRDGVLGFGETTFAPVEVLPELDRALASARERAETLRQEREAAESQRDALMAGIRGGFVDLESYRSRSVRPTATV